MLMMTVKTIESPLSSVIKLPIIKAGTRYENQTSLQLQSYNRLLLLIINTPLTRPGSRMSPDARIEQILPKADAIRKIGKVTIGIQGGGKAWVIPHPGQ